MDRNKEKLFKIIFTAVFVFVCILAAVLVPKLSEKLEKPRQIITTPEPTISMEPVVITAEPLATPTAAVFTPTTLVIDGEIVGTLASSQAAASCVDEIIEYYEAMIESDVSGNIETEIENKIEFIEDKDAKGIVTADALAALLVSDDSPVELKVKSIVENSVLSVIPCTYEIIKDKYLVEDTRIVEVVGKDGTKEVIETAVYENGKKKESSDKKEVITSEPVEGVMRVGTMEKDKYASPSKDEGKEGRETNLEFNSPISGSVIENYGQKNGILHLGLDYEADEGSSIKASCSGTVVSVLERGGYGLVIEIDHGEGFTTRYALLESASVNVGDKVAEGDVIGISGNGEIALHFELRIDGEAYNPRYYLD